MSIPSGIRIENSCIEAYHLLRSRAKGPNNPRFIIFKITDDHKRVVVDEISSESDYEVFRQRLCEAEDTRTGRISAPRYAVYDVEYDLGQDGKRTRSVFISWVPSGTSLKLCMVYASTKEQLRRILDVGVSIHADTPEEIEWKNVLREASGGRA